MPDPREDLWAVLVAKKPLLADPGASVEVTSANFKALLFQFYDQGLADRSRSAPGMSGLMRELFGGRR